MQDKPLFSVIMPVYDGAAYLKEAVESVLHQTFDSWELIIVDDGSEDNSYEIADTFRKEDRRIHLLQHENGSNKGVSASRNLGIQQAKGEWIALLDADDRWFTDKLQKQAKIIEKNGQLTMIYSRGERVFENYSGPKKKKPYGTGTPGLLRDPFLKTLKGFETPTSSVVLNKTLLKNAGGFDESMDYSEDTLLFHKMLLLGDLYFHDSPLLQARHHDASAKQTVNRKKMIRARLTVYLKLLEFEPGKPYRKQISFQAATTGMERVWKYFFRNPFKHTPVLFSAFKRVFLARPMLWQHKLLALVLPVRMVWADALKKNQPLALDKIARLPDGQASPAARKSRIPSHD